MNDFRGKSMLVALKRAGCLLCTLKSAGFSFTDVQSDVLLPSRMHVITFHSSHMHQKAQVGVVGGLVPFSIDQHV